MSPRSLNPPCSPDPNLPSLARHSLLKNSNSSLLGLPIAVTNATMQLGIFGDDAGAPEYGLTGASTFYLASLAARDALSCSPLLVPPSQAAAAPTPATITRPYRAASSALLRATLSPSVRALLPAAWSFPRPLATSADPPLPFSLPQPTEPLPPAAARVPALLPTSSRPSRALRTAPVIPASSSTLRSRLTRSTSPTSTPSPRACSRPPSSRSSARDEQTR